MRRIFLRLLITSTAVAAAAHLLPGITYAGGIPTLVKIAVAFSIVNLFIKPVVMLLALPVEIATLGLFTLVINAGMLLLVERFVTEFTITSFWFPGFTRGPFLLAPFAIPALGTAIIGSLLIAFISTSLYWLTK